MTLRELIESNNYKKVFNYLYQTYFKGKKNSAIIELDLNFYKLWSKLKKLKKSNQDLIKVYITQTPGPEGFIDVCLFDEIKDEILPLDFLNIDDIIDTEVCKALSINDYETLAHILYYLNSLKNIV